VRFTLFRPDPERTLARMRRSWQARARRLMVLCVAALDADDTSGQAALRERLRRQLVRLNESTLMIDAQLGESVPELADVHARRLFDAELALANGARFASALASVCADPAVRGHARAALTALAVDDEDAAVAAAEALQRCAGDIPRRTVLAHRLGASVAVFVAARRQLDEVITAGRGGRPVEAFRPAVELRAGFLPGSVPVSTAASTTPGRRPLDRAAMPPYVRASIQIAVAGSLAIIVGDAVSGPHLQWAVLATFLAFMATTNSGEQVRKALFRVAGTAIGIVLGDLLVRLTGGQVWSSLLIVLVALFFGIYLIRVNYTFMVIGITVTLSQLYAQLGELSWHLLLVRLGETTIGVAAVILTVLLIVPLRPRRVLTAGVLLWFRALSSLLDSVMDRLLGIQSGPLRPKVRELDAAYAALEATAAPLRSTTFGRASDKLSEIRSITAAARSYARSLAVQAELTGPLDIPALHAAARQLRESNAAIDSRIETGQHASYVRCASLLAVAADSLPATETSARLALRDLSLLDGALARLAATLDMHISDLDTAIADATAPNRSAQTSQR
jgi:uncharacterized membrane protein YccC